MTELNPYRRVVLTIIMGLAAFVFATLGSAPLWGADSGQPTLRELVEKRAKQGRPTAEGTSESARLEFYDELGRGVPRSSVHGFLAAARNRNFTRASEYLDLRSLPPETAKSQGPELARRLKIVLDRALWIDPDVLSAEPEGDRDDHLHPARDRVGTISAGDTIFDIFVQRIPQEDGASVWKFAGVTVAEIPELYQEFGYGSLEQIFPAWLFDVSVLGIHLWLWVVLIGLGLLLYPAAMLITWIIAFILRRFREDLGHQVEHFFRGPLRLLIWAILMETTSDVVGPSIALRALAQARTVELIALAWLLARMVDLVAVRGSANLDRKGTADATAVFKPMVWLLKTVAITAALFLWLENLGFNVRTFELAGLTISGIAVVLASQKPLENIFGAVTLFASQSIRVGDMCRFGTRLGIVEQIGLRATRIRTLERSVIMIANSEFLGMHVDNLSKRDRFWYHPEIRLRYETTPDQIRYIQVEVRKMLYAHPKVLSEPLHVRFPGFGQFSLDLEVFAYIGVTHYDEFFEVAGDLNLRIMDIIAAAGTDFAIPAQIEYALPGKPFNDKRAQAIEAEVNEWKARRALYLPNFPKETIAEIKGSLDYPPEGSPEYSQAGV